MNVENIIPGGIPVKGPNQPLFLDISLQSNYNDTTMLKNDRIEEKIQREIRRRAFDRAERRTQETDSRLDFELKLDALAEVSGLARSELEEIAAEVRASFERPRRDYFSIKSQVIVVFGCIGAAVLFLYLIIHWVF